MDLLLLLEPCMIKFLWVKLKIVIQFALHTRTGLQERAGMYK